MKLKTLLVLLVNPSFLEKNKRVIVLETQQCNRPKVLKKYEVYISFRGSLMFHQGVVENWQKISKAYCKRKPLKHRIRCGLIIGVETKQD